MSEFTKMLLRTSNSANLVELIFITRQVILLLLPQTVKLISARWGGDLALALTLLLCHLVENPCQSRATFAILAFGFGFGVGIEWLMRGEEDFWVTRQIPPRYLLLLTVASRPAFWSSVRCIS